jgi:protein-disulfide isomerase
MRTRPALGWVSLTARLVLAGVLGYAALTKIGDPAATVRAVRAYRLLPEGLVVPFAHALPSVELAVAVLLLLGLAVRLSGVLAALLMGMFVIGIASAAARGLRIDCGCFGGGGATANPKYAMELLRDGLLLVLAMLVAVVGRSRLSVDPKAPDAVPGPSATVSRADQRRQRAAEVRAALAGQRAVSRRRVHTGVAALLVALAAVLGMTASSSAIATGPTGPVRTPTGVTAAGGVIVGSKAAPHHLVIFEDPQCPICGQFEKTSGPVVAKAVQQGTISVEYRMRSFLGPESVRAVAALGAAAQEGAFEQLREQVFADQPPERTGGYTIDDLLALGRDAGLTSQSYQDAVRSQTFAGWARQVDDRASKDGNVGTPELRLDGSTLSPQTAFTPADLTAVLAR